MKFNFSLKGSSETDMRYTAVPSRMPDAPRELYMALLSLALSETSHASQASQTSSPNGPGVAGAWSLVLAAPGSGNADGSLTPSPIRGLIRETQPAVIAGLATHFREKELFRPLAFLLTAELAVKDNSEWTAALVTKIVREAEAIPGWLELYTWLNSPIAAGRRDAGPSAMASHPGAIQPGSTHSVGTTHPGGTHADDTTRGSRTAFLRPGRTIRKALAVLFNELDEYRFSRLDAEAQASLKAALILLRPKPAGKTQRELFNKIRKGQIAARPQWEQELGALQERHYDSQELRQLTLRDKWKELISSFRIGYPALLEGLRPILSAGVSGKVLKLAAGYLGNAAAVVRSGQQPFQLLEAYRGLKDRQHDGCSMLIEALEQAAVHSAWNIAGLEEDTRIVIAMDVSNSMKYPVREGSRVHRYDIAPLLAMTLRHKCRQVLTGIVGNTWKPVDLATRQVLAGVDSFQTREGEAGYATNGHLVIQDLLKKGLVMDTVMIFTDNALWSSRPFNQPSGTDLRSLWRQYRQLAPGAKLYLFDLAGYGKKPLEVLPEGVRLIAGWNERIFEVLKAVENGETVLDKLEGSGQ